MNGPVLVEHLYISAAHNFVGHHGRPPGQTPILEVPIVHCIAGRGIEGDRYFDRLENHKGQITFFAAEVYADLCAQLGIRDRAPSVLRRNVITRGLNLNALIDREFELQGVRFFGVEESRPCYWMNLAFGPGAESALQGHGGLRARILSSGPLRATPNLG